MFTQLAAALFSLGLVACAIVNFVFDPPFIEDEYGNPISFEKIPMTVGLECSMSRDHHEPVMTGFLYWNQVAGIDLFVPSKKCGIGDVIVSSSRSHFKDKEGNEIKQAAAAALTRHDAWGSITGGAVRLYLPTWSKLTHHAMKSAVRHEAGHILGFKHSLRGECIMYETISVIPGFDYRDKPKYACDGEKKKIRSIYKRR